MKYDEIMEKVEVTGEMRARILANISKAASENAAGNAQSNAAANAQGETSGAVSGDASNNVTNNASQNNGKVLSFARRMSKFAPIIGAAAAALLCVIIFLPRVLNKNALEGGPTSTMCDTTETCDTTVTCTESVSSDYSYTDTDQCESDVSSNYDGISSPTDYIEYTSKAVRVAWTEDENIYSGAVNGEQLVNGDCELPVYKFDSKSDIEAFKSEYGDIFNPGVADSDGKNDESSNENSNVSEWSFDEETAEYDDEFFTDHSLIMVYITAGSGFYEFDIDEISCDYDTLYIGISRTNDPEVCTDDMAGWLLIAEMNKADIENCTLFYAYQY